MGGDFVEVQQKNSRQDFVGGEASGDPGLSFNFQAAQNVAWSVQTCWVLWIMSKVHSMKHRIGTATTLMEH